MESKKLIAVIGATGGQGGGLAQAILDDPNSPFEVRAITRNPDSEKARNLSARGAEVVAADLDDVASLTRAFSGAYGAYCVTNFWEHFSPEKEIDQARNLAEAARAAGVQHVIWSTLEDTRKLVPLTDDRMPTLMGKYKVPHFDSKGEADRFFADLPTTFLLTSFYWDNFIHFGMGPQVGPDGELAITLPTGDAKLPGIAVADIGKCAFGIFKAGSQYIGKYEGIAGEHLSGAQMAAQMSRALGVPIRCNSLTPEQYRSLGFPGAEDLGNMFQFNRDFSNEFVGARSLEQSRSLNPELMTFGKWLEAHGSEIALPQAAGMS